STLSAGPQSLPTEPPLHAAAQEQAAVNTAAISAPAVEVNLANPLWAQPLDSLQALRARPIFSPSRRPPARANAPASAQLPMKTAQRPTLALIGTIEAQENAMALFIDETNKALVRLKLGEGYRGWVLREVKRREATLQDGAANSVLV